ncbi:Ger(x)C family spore germination protein [Paenibacillus sp. GD4]|uniref:Ger(x)C family spore germination protein n=1 Tax=Paenibacillus sp. GD4 TaxID=3068890 RepID=UPI0027965343|nr:Ger(x)C family spore germination protein [Paenibacillus sp. GD4]MDQ1913935.1 Ger(x)C family spore germination protein [Paenibacillus sp. GD4]
MNKRLAVLIIWLSVICAATGCWNRRELNEVAIALALGLDKVEGGYAISVQIVNPGEIAPKDRGGKGIPVQTYTETGKTVFEALRRMTTKSPRKMLMSHLRVVIFGEELAKEGIKGTIDFLSRDHELRANFAILVSKGYSAERILRVYTIPQEVIPGNKIYKSLDAVERSWAAAKKVTLDELLEDLTKEGKQPSLTGVTLSGHAGPGNIETRENVEQIKMITNIKLFQLAAFKGDKLIGWLTEEESKGYNYILGHVNNSVGQIPCPNGGQLAMEFIRAKSNVKGAFRQGKPSIAVNIQLEENIGDASCAIDLTKTETIEELEKRSEEVIRGYAASAVRKAQKVFQSDILGFGDVLSKTDPQAWKPYAKDWDREFRNLEVNIQVDAKIRRLGTTTNPIQVKGGE